MKDFLIRVIAYLSEGIRKIRLRRASRNREQRVIHNRRNTGNLAAAGVIVVPILIIAVSVTIYLAFDNMLYVILAFIGSVVFFPSVWFFLCLVFDLSFDDEYPRNFKQLSKRHNNPTGTNIEVQKQTYLSVKEEFDKFLKYSVVLPDLDLFEQLERKAICCDAPILHQYYNIDEKNKAKQNYISKIAEEERDINLTRRKNYEHIITTGKDLLKRGEIRCLCVSENATKDDLKLIKKYISKESLSYWEMLELFNKCPVIPANYNKQFNIEYDNLLERVHKVPTAKAVYEQIIFLLLKKEMYHKNYLTSVDFVHGTKEEEQEKMLLHTEAMKDQYPWLYK